MKKSCPTCGKPVAGRYKKYCDAECYHRHQRRGYEGVCEICGCEFLVPPSQFVKFSADRKKVCSKKCYEIFLQNKYHVEITCQNCGKKKFVKKYYVDRGQYKYCSESCRRECERKGFAEEDLVMICARCGKEFRVKPNNLLSSGHKRVYCSEECYRPPVMKNCQYCGKNFRVIPYAKETRKFCSRRCYVAFCENELEKKVKEVLDGFEVNYIYQAQIKRYTVDFLFPDRKLILEADGDYWHTLERVKKRDIKRDELLRSLGFRVIRLTETEINNDPRVVLNALS